MILHRVSTTGTRTSGRNILIVAGAFNSGYNRQLTLTASCTALFITAKRVFLQRDTVQSCEDKLDVGLHSFVFNLMHSQAMCEVKKTCSIEMHLMCQT